METALETLFFVFLLDFAVQWLGCLVSAFAQSEVFFDLVGTCTFVLGSVLAVAMGGVFHERQVTVTTLVAVWAVRLGTFLFMRVLQHGKDSRFDGVRDQPLLLFVYWTIQGVWVFCVLMPVVLLNVSSHHTPWMQPTDVLGLLLWTAGFLVETVADYQKFFFRLEESNKDKWVDSGLWSISRHPNYLGEMVLWWGIYLMCYGSIYHLPLKILGLISPLFTMFLLTRLSGVPMLESAAERKWGSLAAWQAYKRSTPLLLPWKFGRTGTTAGATGTRKEGHAD